MYELDNQTRPQGSAQTRRPRRSKTIAFISATDLPICLKRALEGEFPRVTVEEYADVVSACYEILPPGSLILVDLPFVSETLGELQRLKRTHPDASVALTIPNVFEAQMGARLVAAAPLIRGVLPMNMQLDLWLGAIGIMLHGGEYFPGFALAALAGKPPRDRAHHGSHPKPETQDRDPVQLTGRERDVLRLAAMGHPNKIIAATLNMSQNTVKIHMHNIIRKLGVHNRTQAASVYMSRRSDFDA